MSETLETQPKINAPMRSNTAICSPDLRWRFPRFIKLRKPCECRLCGEIMPIGEAVCKWVTFDDSPQTWRSHPVCYDKTLTDRWDSCDWESHAPGDDF